MNPTRLIKNAFYLGMITAVFCTLASAQEGHGAGNGGLAFVCRNSTGKITKADLIDLKEEELVNLRKMISPQLSKEDALKTIFTNLKIWGVLGAESIQQDLTDGLVKIRSKMIDVPLEYFGLPDPKDYHLKADSKKCPPEVVGLYDDTKSIIRLNREVYDALSSRDQLAFEIHEVLFKTSRMIRPAFSDNARTLNALLFSDPTAVLDAKLVPKSPREEIETLYPRLTRFLFCGLYVGERDVNRVPGPERINPFQGEGEEISGVKMSQASFYFQKRDVGRRGKETLSDAKAELSVSYGFDTIGFAFYADAQLHSGKIVPRQLISTESFIPLGSALTSEGIAQLQCKPASLISQIR